MPCVKGLGPDQALQEIGALPATPMATVLITTRNRRESAICALGSCFAQDYPNLEVIVIDDASDDDTVAEVRAVFPMARVIANGKRRGLVVNRNVGFSEARGTYIFSIDDDAYFSQADIISSIVNIFEQGPRIGAIAIPYIEPLNRRSKSNLADPFHGTPGAELRSYVGCAHAVRRDIALAIGGYRDFYVHQGEERDFCLRLRAAGWRIVYGSSGYIVHTVDPKREPDRIAYYGGRNQILFETLNIPLPDLLWRIPIVCWGMIKYRFSWTLLPLKLKAIGSGIVETIRHWKLRSPVDRGSYRSYLKLASHGAEDWSGPIPPSCQERGTRS
jgi:glycosyltransferase involved in cell wall biosynthesis